MDRLTQKQRQIYEYIYSAITHRGYPPSVREICDAVGLRSPSTVHLHLVSLEERGYISRSTGKTRAISLTDLGRPPEGIPVLGVVAAGQPILAVEDALDYLPYDAGSNGEYFALKIKGDSMIKAGIMDGDMVVVQRQNAARNGDIVIALIGEDATCKRLETRGGGGHVWLIPENDEYEPINGDEAVILGRVTAVIRRY